MKKLNTFLTVCLLGFFCMANEGCEDTDTVIRRDQEKIIAEGNAAAGLPAIKNFREKRLLKDILELRDQDGLLTYTYIVAEQTGKLVFIGESIGYGIPAATQYTNPMKYQQGGPIPQADPNGLFSPSSADGTWVMMLDPKSKKTVPVYVEPRIIVSPFKLTDQL